LSFILTAIGLKRRGFLVLFIPYLTANLWYFVSVFVIRLGLQNLGESTLYQVINTYFNLCIVFSLAINSLFVEKTRKCRLIYFWSVAMPILMALLYFSTSVLFFTTLIFLLSYVFSLGVLGYSAYFRGLVDMKERGRISGFLASLSVLTCTVFLFFFRVGSFGYSEFIITCIVLGVVTFMTRGLKPEERFLLTTSQVYVSDYEFKTVALYFIPWFLFSFINGTLSQTITVQSTLKFKDMVVIAELMSIIASSSSAFLSGIMADWIGRKITVIIGISLFGFSVTLSSIAYTPILFISSWLLNGASWGVIQTIYLLVIWGDFSNEKECAPYYALGFMPFYFSKAIGYLFMPEMLTISILTASVIALLLLFFSAIFIAFAREPVDPFIRDGMNKELYFLQIKKLFKKNKSRR